MKEPYICGEYSVNVFDGAYKEWNQLKLFELLSPHVLLDTSKKAKALLSAADKAGYERCALEKDPGNLHALSHVIERMEDRNSFESLPVYIFEHGSSEYFVCGNLLTAIYYMRKYGPDLRLKKLPHYFIRLKEKDFEKVRIEVYARKKEGSFETIPLFTRVAEGVQCFLDYKRECCRIHYLVEDFFFDNPFFF